MAPKDALPQDSETNHQAAGGRPIGVGHPTYAEAAERLRDNGYEPLPIKVGLKRPEPARWTEFEIDSLQVTRWSARFGDRGVGLRTGRLMGLDIDVLDADRAHEIHDLATRRFGETLLRVGLWPKRLLIYRTDAPRAKRKLGKIELLGLGQQFVAFGVHPDTGRPYQWPGGETPLDVPLDALPLVTAEAADAFLAEAAALLPAPGGQRTRRNAAGGGATQSQEVNRDASGRIVDGRDFWLSSVAFHTVHDAVDAREPLDPGALHALAQRCWARFADTADLGRPRGRDGGVYDFADACAKIADKLRLLREGRLPPRRGDDVEPVDSPEALPVDEARAALDAALGAACDRIFDWRVSEDGEPAPQIGIKATVGLGKSATARRHLLGLRQRLRAIGAPDRLVVFTPSLRLADEAAAAWGADGVRTAVLRGYEARGIGGADPMCADLEAVRLAVAAGRDVHEAACDDGKGNRCALFAGCPKQANRRAVAEADVVFAAYDALYTGFAVETSSIGALVIDESPWPRAFEETVTTTVDGFEMADLMGIRAPTPDAAGAAMADLHDLRGRAAAALRNNGDGPVMRAVVAAAGLTARDCALAGSLEGRSCRDPDLRPGAPADQRRRAAVVAAGNDRVRRRQLLWRALETLLDDADALSPRLRIEGSTRSDGGGGRAIATAVKRIHPNLAEIPVLHLDATLRPALARRILPRLETTEIEAAASHMTLRLVTGGFGKTALIADPRADATENRRRAGNIRACVDYVVWEARRVTPGRVLVVTYKDCEAAFQGIPGVETGHFNAIAGLDGWRDVSLLIVLGRPLPSDIAVAPICGAFHGRWPEGGYRSARRGLRMRDGAVRAVRTIAHQDESAETIRAAICDDELIQAIGRGRGVNRGQDDPLEVHVLADVALPLAHDAILPWEVVKPDLLQRMLLAGVAVDSPTDAAALHPTTFTGANQAKKQFQSCGFEGQIPMGDTYRGMTLKSATYRRPGRGRSMQRAWWLDGDADIVRAALERRLGALAEWGPMTR